MKTSFCFLLALPISMMVGCVATRKPEPAVVTPVATSAQPVAVPTAVASIPVTVVAPPISDFEAEQIEAYGDEWQKWMALYQKGADAFNGGPQNPQGLATNVAALEAIQLQRLNVAVPPRYAYSDGLLRQGISLELRALKSLQMGVSDASSKRDYTAGMDMVIDATNEFVAVGKKLQQEIDVYNASNPSN